VQIETTSNNMVNVLGVSEFMESFKQDNPAFFPSKTPAKINTNSPGGKTEMSAADMLKLEKSDPAAYAKAFADMQAAKK
jgi:hypothetical protein